MLSYYCCFFFFCLMAHASKYSSLISKITLDRLRYIPHFGYCNVKLV
ncbi:hypothetical protein yaldo0001_32760 [Yersinia aldovae ATCC 35236]|nr:hypothetical protein yaldo0001_32760 [Yersinia aldovae ATCC 35236]